MRIWDLPVNILCDKHLLGEHRELHAIWNIITKDKKGYSKHPETKRWVGKLKALNNRHAAEVAEMKKRGFSHNSPLNPILNKGSSIQDIFIDSIEKQYEILKNKKCDCKIKKVV